MHLVVAAPSGKVKFHDTLLTVHGILYHYLGGCAICGYRIGTDRVSQLVFSVLCVEDSPLIRSRYKCLLFYYLTMMSFYREIYEIIS